MAISGSKISLLKLDFIKSNPIRIIGCIFVANFFYDDPSLYLYKRIIYSIFIYYAIYEIIRFYIYPNPNKINFHLTTFRKIYLPIVGLFIFYNLLVDIRNPQLNWVTLLNNPFAMLAAGPIFMFVIGAYANDEDLDWLIQLFLWICAAFFIVFALPIFGKVKYYQGYVCAYCFVPLFFLSQIKHKYKLFTWGLIIMGLYFSQVSGYRIIALRILLILSLFVGFTVCKKFPLLKVVIIAVVIFGLYTFLVNLQETLYFFKDIIGVRDFDDDDTRGFLYEEVFGELQGMELVFGRGFLGTYFSEYFLMILTQYRDTSGDHYIRFNVEVGFLSLLLKGGFFWYILYIIPLVYTSVLGIFKYYKDPIVYFISIFLMTELFLMYVENIPYFNFQFSLIFFLAGFAIHRIHKIKNKHLYPESNKELTT